jgi:hypothetical protein
MDTPVTEGPPIQRSIHGEDAWRSENEWPFKRSQFRDLYRGGPYTRERPRVYRQRSGGGVA